GLALRKVAWHPPGSSAPGLGQSLGRSWLSLAKSQALNVPYGNLNVRFLPNCRAGKERATFLEHSTNGLESNPLLVREPIHEQDELAYHQAVQIVSFLLILRQYPALASVNRAQIAVGRPDRVVVGALEQDKALPQVDFHFEHVR